MTNARDWGAVPWGTLPSDLDVTHTPELPEGANIVHHYHHSAPSQPTVSVKAERNSKGYNWEISVSGTHSVDEAMALMDKARNEMEHRFGSGVV